MRSGLHEADGLERAVAAIAAVQRFPRRPRILHSLFFVGFECGLAASGPVVLEVAHLQLIYLVVLASDLLLKDERLLLHSFDLLVESTLVVALQLELRHQLLNENLELGLHL